MKRLVETVAKARRFVRTYFPERQVFFRSNGEVRFVKLSPRVQIAATVAALAGAGWLAVVSVDFLMEDQVLAAREQKIRDMAVAYDS